MVCALLFCTQDFSSVFPSTPDNAARGSKKQQVHTATGLAKGEVHKDTVPVEEGLEKWVLSPDAQGCFNQARKCRGREIVAPTSVKRRPFK